MCADYWGILTQEKTERLHLDAMINERQNTIFFRHLRLVVHAHHERDTGAINIRIQKSRSQSGHPEGHGKIGRHGTLANPPFATGHGNDVLYARQRRRIGQGVLILWSAGWECPTCRYRIRLLKDSSGR